MIDSGYGIQDFEHPNLVTRVFTSFVHTPRDPVFCAINQLPKFNIDPHDVKHIILTHMHIDHAGGIADFPWATNSCLGTGTASCQSSSWKIRNRV